MSIDLLLNLYMNKVYVMFKVKCKRMCGWFDV